MIIKFKSILIVWLILLLVSPDILAECATPTVYTEMPKESIILSDVDSNITLTVRVASDRITRMAGYQNVCPSDANGSAILFIFPYEVDADFHMNNVYINLDIAFFDAQGRFINSETMLAPTKGEQSTLYSSDSRAQYALELPQGEWEKLDLTDGIELTIPVSH